MIARCRTTAVNTSNASRTGKRTCTRKYPPPVHWTTVEVRMWNLEAIADSCSIGIVITSTNDAVNGRCIGDPCYACSNHREVRRVLGFLSGGTTEAEIVKVRLFGAMQDGSNELLCPVRILLICYDQVHALSSEGKWATTEQSKVKVRSTPLPRFHLLWSVPTYVRSVSPCRSVAIQKRLSGFAFVKTRRDSSLSITAC